MHVHTHAHTHTHKQTHTKTHHCTRKHAQNTHTHTRTYTHLKVPRRQARMHTDTPKSQHLRMVSYPRIMAEALSLQANFTPLHIAQMQNMSEMVKLLKDDATWQCTSGFLHPVSRAQQQLLWHINHRLSLSNASKFIEYVNNCVLVGNGLAINHSCDIPLRHPAKRNKTDSTLGNWCGTPRRPYWWGRQCGGRSNTIRYSKFVLRGYAKIRRAYIFPCLFRSHFTSGKCRT